MDKSKLSDGQWVHLIGRLKKTPGIRVGCEATCRRFARAVLWILRAGAQWRVLPDRLGHWSSVFKRFACLMPVWRVAEDAGQCLGQGGYAKCLHRQHRGTGARMCSRSDREQCGCRGTGPLSGRFWLQDTRTDRCAGLARTLHFDGRAGSRHHLGYATHARHQYGRTAR